MKKEHRPGVSAVNLVKRHLKLESIDQDGLQDAVAEIDTLSGLDSVTLNEKKRRLDLAYDAAHLCIDSVEEVLDRRGIEMSRDWWARLKEDHYRFVDQNVKDNARHEPWSCHQSPTRSRQKR